MNTNLLMFLFCSYLPEWWKVQSSLMVALWKCDDFCISENKEKWTRISVGNIILQNSFLYFSWVFSCFCSVFQMFLETMYDALWSNYFMELFIFYNSTIAMQNYQSHEKGGLTIIIQNSFINQGCPKTRALSVPIFFFLYPPFKKN